MPEPDLRVGAVIIGAGQAGLSAAHHLGRLGITPVDLTPARHPDDTSLLLDHAPRPGGAWQFRWPSLTLAAANNVHDLPGLGLQQALGTDAADVRASAAMPEYFGDYEEKFDLRAQRPVDVTSVSRDGERYLITARRLDDTGGELLISAGVVLNASGTWDQPFWPVVPGHESFNGIQVHAHDYRDPEQFAGRKVVVVGAGISGVQLLIELAESGLLASTLWVSRRQPTYHDAPFTPEHGRQAVARVEERVRQGLPPGSVVSVTGLPVTDAIRRGREQGILDWNPMFTSMHPDGVGWPEGRGPGGADRVAADAILWCTGFRSSLRHLRPLGLRNHLGGITMTGPMATQVAGEPRLHLLGYGPTASTIGANRAGRIAARAVLEYLGSS